MIEFKTILDSYDKSSRMILIDIPFNLWDKLGRKGMLEVDLIINNIEIPNVGLLSRGNGNYSIRLTKNIQNKLGNEIENELIIKMELSAKPEKVIDSFRKDYINIKEPQLVLQTNTKNCGQACIAMLSGKDIQYVSNLMSSNHETSIGQLINALDLLHIKHAEKNKRISLSNSVIPDIAILTVHLPSYTHWVLYYKGKYYDPEFGVMSNYDKGKITSYLECFE